VAVVSVAKTLDLTLRYAAAFADSVVATDPVSVDADYDNGAALHS
jgi:hypothetical protein